MSVVYIYISLLKKVIESNLGSWRGVYVGVGLWECLFYFNFSLSFGSVTLILILILGLVP